MRETRHRRRLDTAASLLFFRIVVEFVLLYRHCCETLLNVHHKRRVNHIQGKDYFNYKSVHGIVMMALAPAPTHPLFVHCYTL